jgi:plasmid stabilization system protein ParE
MRTLVFSVAAQRDIDSIYSYSTTVWGENRAKRTLADIKQVAQLICDHPELGRKTVRTDVWQKSVSRLPFVLLYKVCGQELLVLQLVHTSRDHNS